MIPACTIWHGALAASTARMRQRTRFTDLSGCLAVACLALPGPPDQRDDDDDEQQARSVSTGRHRVDLARDVAHFVVGHGGYAIFRGRRVEAHGLQLAG